MNKDGQLRIPLLGSVDLGRLAGRRTAEHERAHLHWDRRRRRWVPHEDAQLSDDRSGHLPAVERLP